MLLPVLTQAGIAGVVLWWLMTRVEDRLKEHTKAVDALRHTINRQTLAHLLDVLSRSSVNPDVKRQATAIVDEIRAEQVSTQQRNGL